MQRESCGAGRTVEYAAFKALEEILRASSNCNQIDCLCVVYGRQERWSAGLAITEQQSVWRTTAIKGEGDTHFARAQRSVDTHERHADEPKWARWKVTVVVVLFCAAFWSGVAYIVTRLIS